MALHLNEKKNALCQVGFEIGSLVHGEEDENVKSSQTDRRTDGQTTDNGQQAIRKSSLELSTQVNLKGIGWKAETQSKYVFICHFLYQGINSYRIR